jgi:hypothetical protein
MQNPLFYFFGLSLILLACFHAVALTFSLYYIYLWLDMPMHVLGGVTIALGYQSSYVFKKYTAYFPHTFLATVAAALIIGGGWELYEYVVGLMTGGIFSATDTLKDIVMDCVGGAVGFIVAKAIRTL